VAANVSIIIPCYNTGRYLREAIDSALAQTYRDVEVIVVDDGSTDDSAAIAASYPNVRLIRQANSGVSAARNRAAAEATSDYLVFLDADDRLLPDAVQIGIDCFREHPEAAFVFGAHRSIAADGSLREVPPHDPARTTGYAELLAGNTLLPPACAVFRRDAVQKAGGFPVGVKLSEDHDLYLRIAREHPVACHGRIVVEYRYHSGNVCRVSPFRTLRASRQTLIRERDFVRGKPELERAWRRGWRHWGRIYGPGMSFELLRSIRRGRLLYAAVLFGAILRNYPEGFAMLLRHRLALWRPRGAGAEPRRSAHRP
jgi:glycosyltransferase involved in cell wall biosynthesis